MSYCVVFWQLGTNQETLAVNNLNIYYHEMYNIMMIVHSRQSITWNQQVIVNIYIFLAIQIYFTNKEFNTDGFTKQFVRTKLLVGDLHLLRINSSCIYNLTNYFCTKKWIQMLWQHNCCLSQNFVKVMAAFLSTFANTIPDDNYVHFWPSASTQNSVL